MTSTQDDKAQYLAPTVKQGADFIEMCFTREYKLSCIKFWRDLFGDELADQIMNELKARKNKRAKEHIVKCKGE